MNLFWQSLILIFRIKVLLKILKLHLYATTSFILKYKNVSTMYFTQIFFPGGDKMYGINEYFVYLLIIQYSLGYGSKTKILHMGLSSLVRKFRHAHK